MPTEVSNRSGVLSRRCTSTGAVAGATDVPLAGALAERARATATAPDFQFGVAPGLNTRHSPSLLGTMSSVPSSPDGTVEVVPYSEAWPSMFDDARVGLAMALGDAARSIEHIGSTAVEGLSAKPTIDILIVVERIEDFLERLLQVEALGFDYRASNTFVGGDDHLFLRKVANGKRTHHVHVLRVGSPEIEAYRLFRDALRSDAALRKEYETIKTDLAARHPDDRMRYVTEKAEWVEGVVRSLKGCDESPD